MKFSKSTANTLASLVMVGSVLVGTQSIFAGDDDKPDTHPAHADGDAATGKDAVEQVKLPPEAVRKYGLRVNVVKKRKVTSHVQAPARISFNTESMAVVGVGVPGRVSDVKVRAGQIVKKGDVLLIVESPELGEAQSDLLQKRTTAVTAAAVVEPAKSAFERAKSLYDQSQGITLTELQKREVEYNAAQNGVLTANAAVAAAENKLLLLGMDQTSLDDLVKSSRITPKYVVRSPIDGTIIERAVNLGELVTPEREKLFVVADTTKLWAIVDVPEARLHEIAENAKATLTVAATGDQSFEGIVSYVAASMNEATRSGEVRVELSGSPALKPGMFAQADISSEFKGDAGEESVLAVPIEAVQTINGSTSVFLPVKGQENTYQLRLVSVGQSVGGLVTIVSGLEEGESIVTSGTFILKADLLKSSATDED